MIYIGLKLFNFSDKIQASELEKALLSRGLSTFMPFRDSDENNIQSPERTRIIYEKDMEILTSPQLEMMVALFDGITKDEGIAFELGYCHGKGIKTYIINTDFIWYSNGESNFIMDPIISGHITQYTHAYKLHERSSWQESLEYSQMSVFLEATDQIVNLLQNSTPVTPPVPNKCYDICIDIGGAQYEYQQLLTSKLKHDLTSLGLTVTCNSRYAHSIAPSWGNDDYNNLLNSEYYLFFGDEPETNSGSAFLLGLATSLGKKRIMYKSSPFIILGDNGHRMEKNLMIEYSSDYIVHSYEELITLCHIIADKKKKGGISQC